MSNVKYNVVMKTPVGLRQGIIDLCIVENRISGTIDILGHIEPLEGYIDSKGKCIISGRIITLMQTIQYKAVGQISQSRIDLKLQGEKNVFYLTGIALDESEVKA